MSFAVFSGLARVGATLPGFFLNIGAKVQDALKDGQVSADEAEAIALAASQDAGDVLTVKVKGVDIVDAEAQDAAAKFAGRVTRNLVVALRGGA